MKSLTLRFCLSLVVIILISRYSIAQDSLSVWKKGGAFNLNIAQVGLKNWVGGGQNSFSVTGLQKFNINMDKPLLKWTNQLDLGFGMLKQGTDKKFYKSEDKIIFISKLSRNFTKGWYFSGIVDFRSQLAPGHNFTNDSTGEQKRTLISRFLAPGYLIVSPGVEFKLNDYLYTFISPVSAKFTFVNDDALSARGAFGVPPGKKVRSEFGAYLNAGFKKRLVENVNLDTKVSLFSNYETFGNIDINWELTLLMKVNKYITTSISTQLLYDDDIKVKREDGTTGPAVQYKEVINVGLLYQFSK